MSNIKDINLLDAVDVYKLVLERKIKIFPSGFWTKPEALENSAKCIKYLFEEKLRFCEQDIKENLTVKLIKENKLAGMLTSCFNGDSYNAINNAYPNKFKPWEFKKIYMNNWTMENSKEATRWLVEEKLKFSDDELKDKLSYKTFKDNGLGSMLDIFYKKNAYNAINDIYPNKFKPWEFKKIYMSSWTKEKSKEAIKWLIEEKLKLTDEELKNELSQKLFMDNGLSGMLQQCFNNSPYEAVNSVYPNKFRHWEFKYIGKNYWSKERGIEATKWLIEEKLNFDEEDIKDKLSANLFRDNGLGGMLYICFNNSPYEAINSTYPNKYKIEEFRGYKLKLR